MRSTLDSEKRQKRKRKQIQQEEYAKIKNIYNIESRWTHS